MEQQWNRVPQAHDITRGVSKHLVKVTQASSNGGIGVHHLIFTSHVVTHAILKRYSDNVTPKNLAESPDRERPTDRARRDQTCRYLHRADPTVGRVQRALEFDWGDARGVLMQVQKKGHGHRSGSGVISIGGKNRG
jgi:hypothetical protein